MRRALLVLLVFALPLAAQDAKPPQKISIFSKVLNEQRNVLVRVPASYETSGRPYIVLYMTDGDRQLPHTAATVDFLVREGRMPEVIMVGISNTDRTRDLTPTHVEVPQFGNQRFRTPTSGGGDRFLAFIEGELIPHIEKNYRTRPFRVFAGHSFGGLFAMHALVTRPKLFNALIAVSPTFGWDNTYINRRAEEFLKASRDANNTVVVTLGDEGDENARELERFRTLMQANAPASLDWAALHFADEDHGSVVMPSHYAGLKKIFAPWRFPIAADDDARGLMGRAKEHYARLSDRVGYEVPVPEGTMNLIGYRLLQIGDTDDAIEAFKMNVATYPKSANVYDSLGEAYERAGELELAKESYGRAASIGKKVGDPNTNVYEQNRDRVAKALAAPRKQASIEEIGALVARLGGTVVVSDGAIAKVDLHETAITDEDLAFLAQLPELRELDLRLTKIGDRALDHLRGLRKLETLNVFRTGISDEGLARLRQLTELRTLLMGGTRVTSAGLARLDTQTKLRKLSLFRTAVDDSGVVHLKRLPGLEVVLVGGSTITEAGMNDLCAWKPEIKFGEQT
jgi:predicted alpha/beta superfamily hydrolase